MKSYKRTSLIAAATLLLGLILGWLFFGGSNNASAESHTHETEAAAETIWTCSMHPQIRQGEPGDCPICGMDLIPLANESEGDMDPMAVRMSPTAMQLANISTARIGSTEAIKSLKLNGKVQADERLLRTQSSHIPGRIEKLSVNFTGEFVSKGQVIAHIYSPELVTAQEELFEAEKIKDTQPLLFSAAKEKLRNWKLSDAQIEQIIRKSSIQESFPILADVSGYITKKLVNQGDYVLKGEGLYEIADLSSVWVLFDVYESDMSWIHKGDKISYSVSSLPGEEFSGKISFVDPVIDSKTRVAKARLEVGNAGMKLKPEMFVSGTLEASLPQKENAIVVPKTAIMWTGKRSVVYVKSESNSGISFLLREVDLGPALGQSYIIKGGLEKGEEIAVNGTFSIDAAAQLAGKASMMSPEGGAKPPVHNHGEMDMGTDAMNENMSSAEFMVYGNCGMCKTRIEEAAKTVKGVHTAVWDQHTKMLSLHYDPSLTNTDKVQKVIAASGHDTGKFRAPDDVYENLPGCCLYDRP